MCLTCLSMQDYLREQPDNVKSFNIIGEVTQFLNVIYSNIKAKSIDLVIQLFDTMTEFTAVSVLNNWYILGILTITDAPPAYINNSMTFNGDVNTCCVSGNVTLVLSLTSISLT